MNFKIFTANTLRYIKLFKNFIHVYSPKSNLGTPLCNPFKILWMFQLLPSIVLHQLAIIWYPTVKYDVW